MKQKLSMVSYNLCEHSGRINVRANYVGGESITPTAARKLGMELIAMADEAEKQ